MTQALMMLNDKPAPIAPTSTRRYVAQRFVNGAWANIGTNATHAEALQLARLYKGARIVALLTGGKFILIK